MFIFDHLLYNLFAKNIPAPDMTWSAPCHHSNYLHKVHLISKESFCKVEDILMWIKIKVYKKKVKTSYTVFTIFFSRIKLLLKLAEWTTTIYYSCLYLLSLKLDVQH